MTPRVAHPMNAIEFRVTRYWPQETDQRTPFIFPPKTLVVYIQVLQSFQEGAIGFDAAVAT